VEKNQIVVKAIMIPFFDFLNKRKRNYGSILKEFFSVDIIHPPPPKSSIENKGQSFSKCLFGIFSSSKNEQKNDTSSRIVFVRFLEELKTPKRHFEIN
jgi:hypothetical protein